MSTRPGPAAGVKDKENAAELSVSLNTVKTHVRNILAKTDAANRHQAETYAVRAGMLRPPGQASMGGQEKSCDTEGLERLLTRTVATVALFPFLDGVNND